LSPKQSQQMARRRTAIAPVEAIRGVVAYVEAQVKLTLLIIVDDNHLGAAGLVTFAVNRPIWMERRCVEALATVLLLAHGISPRE
jgi:hypothetical protein